MARPDVAARGKPGSLGSKERKLILAAVLFERRTGQAPTWSEIGRMTGLYASRRDHQRLGWIIGGLRRKGLVTFEDDVPRSLRVLPHALALALGERR